MRPPAPNCWENGEGGWAGADDFGGSDVSDGVRLRPDGYYAQTLIDLIGPEIGLSKGWAGAITTLTQLGYGIGLFAIVRLGDIFETGGWR